MLLIFNNYLLLLYLLLHFMRHLLRIRIIVLLIIILLLTIYSYSKDILVLISVIGRRGVVRDLNNIVIVIA